VALSPGPGLESCRGRREAVRLLPGVAVSTKTVEWCISRCGQAVARREEARAQAAAEDERTVLPAGPALTHPAAASSPWMGSWCARALPASGRRSRWPASGVLGERSPTGSTRGGS
jgi:hypothetical protein